MSARIWNQRRLKKRLRRHWRSVGLDAYEKLLDGNPYPAGLLPLVRDRRLAGRYSQVRAEEIVRSANLDCSQRNEAMLLAPEEVK